MEHNNKRSNIARGVYTLKAKELRLEAKLKKQNARVKKAIQLHINEKKIADIFVKYHINTRLDLKNKVKTITFDSGVKARIDANDKSIWIISETGNIPMPVGKMEYKEFIVWVEPEGIIKDVLPRPEDTLSPKIEALKKKISNLYNLL